MRQSLFREGPPYYSRSKSKHMNRNNIFSFLGVMLVVLFAFACKKEARYETITPPVQAHFTNQSFGRYIIQTATTTYKVPVGVTQPSSSERTINVTVTSPTGATEGTHYTLSSNTITLAPGEVLDTITVQGNYNQYLSGRTDTLFFALSGEGIEESDYNNRFTLVLRGPCFENEINGNLQDLVGFYNSTYEGGTFGLVGGPYSTEVTFINQTSPTTAIMRVRNLGDQGWSGTFTLDWTDLSNPKITFVAQVVGGDAGYLSSTYAGSPVQIRPAASTTSTFSFCNQTFRIIANIGPNPAGYFGGTYIIEMAR